MGPYNRGSDGIDAFVFFRFVESDHCTVFMEEINLFLKTSGTSRY